MVATSVSYAALGQPQGAKDHKDTYLAYHAGRS